MAIPLVLVANGFAAWLVHLLVVVVIGTIAVMFPDLVLGIVKMLVDWLVSLINNAAPLELPTVAETMNDLPIEMLQMMKRIRIHEAFALIVTAVSLRLLGRVFSWLYLIGRVA